MDPAISHAQFRTTQWSLIDAVRELTPGADGAEAADPAASQRRRTVREELARRYWPPCYAFLRRTGQSRDNARDIVQGFFADVVYPRDLFERADPARGRLRSWLLTALKNYHKDQLRRRHASTVSINFNYAEDRDAVEPDTSVSPEDNFVRLFALGFLHEAMRRCEVHFAADKPAHWNLFVERELLPAIAGTERPELKNVAPKHGFAKVDRAAAAIQVVRERLKLLLREVVAETMPDPAEREEEYQTVLALLRSGTHA